MSYEKLQSKGDDGGNNDDSLLEDPRLRMRRLRWAIWSWMLNIVLLLGNTVLFAVLISKAYTTETFPSKALFPDIDLVGYKRETWNLSLGAVSPYTGPPGPEVDARWEEITANPHSNVNGLMATKKQLDLAGQASIAFANGKYLALPDVFHQLHCLNHLRKVIYKDHYRDELEDGEVAEAHTSHCIDSIRSSLQCSADTSLITFSWIVDYPIPWPNFSSTHQCRDWEKLLTWARTEHETMVSAAKNGQGLLQPPGVPTGESAWKVPLREEDIHVLDDQGRIVSK